MAAVAATAAALGEASARGAAPRIFVDRSPKLDLHPAWPDAGPRDAGSALRDAGRDAAAEMVYSPERQRVFAKMATTERKRVQWREIDGLDVIDATPP